LEFSFSFDTSHTGSEQREGREMSSWSEEAARRSRERQQSKSIRDQKSLQDRNTLDAKGRALWSTIRNTLGRKCEEFNAEPGNVGTLSLMGNQSEVNVSIASGREMISGTYADDTITFMGKNGVKCGVQLRVRLTNDGLDVLLSDGRDRPVDPEELANDVIETLLQASGR
jgi:hypothetical protein